MHDCPKKTMPDFNYVTTSVIARFQLGYFPLLDRTATQAYVRLQELVRCLLFRSNRRHLIKI